MEQRPPGATESPPSNLVSNRRRRISLALAIGACAIISMVVTIWPRDMRLGGDVAIIFAKAQQGDAEHHLNRIGLYGSTGHPYGPIPIQMYQGLMLITHDLPTLVRIHAGLFAAVTAAALLWLVWNLGWTPWLAPLAMLAPWFWTYSRLLWDNPFAIPVGTLMIAGYVAFLKRGSRTAFVVAAACAATLPFIHPMTGPLVAAIGLHMVWRHRPAIIRNIIPLSVVAALLLICVGPYCLYIAVRLPVVKHLTHHDRRAAPAAQPETNASAETTPEDRPLPRPEAFIYPLFGGRVLSAYDVSSSLSNQEMRRFAPFSYTARYLSFLAFPLIWAGMLACLARCYAGWMPRARPTDALAGIAIVTLVFQSLMEGAMKILPEPHYYNGTWIIYAFCFWVGIRQLARLRIPGIPLACTAALAYAAGAAVSTALLAIHAHHAVTVR